MNTKKDNNKSIFKNIYPISVNNQQCVGPCYHKGSTIIHPVTLNEVGHDDINFCPVNAFINQQNNISFWDKCFMPSTRETKIDNFLKSNILVPQMHFSSDFFIKIYYKINNIDDMFNWLDAHAHDPYKTRERVFNNGMIVYGDQIIIIDHRMVHFVNDILIYYLSKIYKRLKKYIVMKDDTVILINNSDKQNIDSNDKNTISIIKSYIREKFLGSDNVYQLLSKFVRYYKNKLTDSDMSKVLVDYMIDYTLKRINLTLEQ